MNKIAIALDILRQYNENLEVSGKETKIYAIDGYGERVSFKALIYGYWYVFSSIYGSNTAWYGYPKDMYWNMIWGDGIIGWNRPVTNPVIDIPKALTLYTQLAASAASYKDKFSRETAFKKLFYRDGSYAHNVFIEEAIQADDDGYIQTAGSILQKEDPNFYEFVNNKLYDLWDLAANEAKNVSVPPKLKFLFDSRPVAKMYDATPEDESYKDGLLNMNSSVIQANQFYLTFLTSFEQIIYQYTKQTFPIKLFGTIANLYSSYVKLITNYVKPYHARLIDKAPIVRFGGGLEESVAVGDILRLDPTVQIFSDVVKWRFDNPYDYRPDEYDKLDKIWDEFWFGGKPDDTETNPWDWEGPTYYEDAPEAGIVYNIEDKENVYHIIDRDLLYTDNKLQQNNLYEDITITGEAKYDSVKPRFDNIPFSIYPSSLHTLYKDKWIRKEEDPPIIAQIRRIVETETPDIVEYEFNNGLMSVEEARRIIRKYDSNAIYKLVKTEAGVEDLLEYDWLNNYIENVSDRDLCIITDSYTKKDEYRISDIKFKKRNYDIDITGSKIGIITDDICHVWSRVKRTDHGNLIIDDNGQPIYEWIRTKIPCVSDIFNRIDPPNNLISIYTFSNGHSIDVSPCRYLSDNSMFLEDLDFVKNIIAKNTYYTSEEVPIKEIFKTRYSNFIKFFIFIPAHTKAILPEIEYNSRKKI